MSAEMVHSLAERRCPDCYGSGFIEAKFESGEMVRESGFCVACSGDGELDECDQCNTIVRDDDAFCRGCGQALDDDDAPKPKVVCP